MNEEERKKARRVNNKIILELLGHETLTHTQKLIGLILYMYSGNVPAIRLSNAYLINVLKVDNTTITRSMKALEQEGYIQREMIKNSHNNRKRRIIHLLKNE